MHWTSKMCIQTRLLSIVVFALLSCCLSENSCLHAAYLFKNGQFINQKYVATGTVEEHFQQGLDALKVGDWKEAQRHFTIITVSFEEASLAQEAHYYLGVALYQDKELDLANSQFSLYIQKCNSPSHLEDVYRYKLDIAQALASGTKSHMFGCESLPKWMSGHAIALETFDEIASALPNHDLAAMALIGKAKALHDDEQFLSAVETYQTAIRRFPGSSFALQAYEGISACYTTEIERQPQNADALALAEINLRELKKDFPQAAENQKIDQQFTQMREMNVAALYETGQLFERMSQPKAAVLYYFMALNKFPTAAIAQSCRQRLKELSTYAEELHIPIDVQA